MSDLNAMPDEKAEGSVAGQESVPPEGNEQAGSNVDGGDQQEPVADPAVGTPAPAKEVDAGNESAASGGTTGEALDGSTAAAAEDAVGAADVAMPSTGAADESVAGNVSVDASISSASDADSLPSSSGEATAPDVAPVADVVRTSDAQMPSHPVYPAPAQPAPTTSPTPALAAQAADPTLAAIASATTIVNSAPTTDLSQKTADAESDPHEQMLVIMRNSLEQVARDTGDFHAAQAFVHLVQIDAAALHGAVQGSIAQFFASRGVDLGTASDAQ